MEEIFLYLIAGILSAMLGGLFGIGGDYFSSFFINFQN